MELAWSAAAYPFEKQVQGWTRRTKQALVRGDDEVLVALARGRSVQVEQLREAFGELDG